MEKVLTRRVNYDLEVNESREVIFFFFKVETKLLRQNFNTRAHFQAHTQTGCIESRGRGSLCDGLGPTRAGGTVLRGGFETVARVERKVRGLSGGAPQKRMHCA